MIDVMNFDRFLIDITFSHSALKLGFYGVSRSISYTVGGTYSYRIVAYR